MEESALRVHVPKEYVLGPQCTYVGTTLRPKYTIGVHRPLGLFIQFKHYAHSGGSQLRVQGSGFGFRALGSQRINDNVGALSIR